MKITKKSLEQIIREEVEIAIEEAFGDEGAFEADGKLKADSGLNPEPVPVKTKPGSIASLAVQAMQAIIASSMPTGEGMSPTKAGGMRQDTGAGKGRDFVDGQMGPLTRGMIRKAGSSSYDGAPMTIRFDGTKWIISEIGSFSSHPKS